MNDFETLSRIIRKRRAIYPETYSDRKIDKQLIQQILENANWAPTHRKTEPWRFHVFTGQELDRLSQYMQTHYQENTPAEEFSEYKLQKTREKALQSSHVIAICMQRDPSGSLPQWEEEAAVACAVMNMWLSCAALGIGCYWSSPKSAMDAGKFLLLSPGQRCLGWFYMGYPREGLVLNATRGDLSSKVVWHEGS